MTFDVKLPATLFEHSEAQKTFVEQAYFLDKDIRKITLKNGQASIQIERESSATTDLENELVRLAERTVESFKRVKVETFEFSEGNPIHAQDPHPELVQSKQIRATSSGQYVYEGDLLRLIRALDRFAYDMAKEMGAVEQEYPTRIAAATLTRCGYLSEFPQHAFLCAPLQPTRENLEEFSRYVRSADAEKSKSDPVKFLGPPSAVLAPTVCYHCFESLIDASIAEPNQMFTAVSKCHRHEYQMATGLERLQTFTMRELIFFGDGKYVETTKAEIMKRTWQFVLKMGLRARIISANDPFFTSEAAKKRSYQSMLGLKQELQVELPYSGKWLAVGSFNNHRSTLVDAFNIKGPAGENLNSGCVGFGFERWALSIIAQFGTDPSAWNVSLKT